MNLIFVGPPGAGKGTQAKLVCEKFNIPHISTGDMLRSAIREGTELGKKAKSFIEAGDLVPDEVVIGIVKDRLAHDDCKKGYLLDGFPRTVAQAQALGEFATIEHVIMVDVEDEKLVKRISGRRSCSNCTAIYHVDTYHEESCEVCAGNIVQREDDREEIVRNRLHVYHEKTAPLIDYYKNLDILEVVDGDNDIQVIFEEICNVLA